MPQITEKSLQAETARLCPPGLYGRGLHNGPERMAELAERRDAILSDSIREGRVLSDGQKEEWAALDIEYERVGNQPRAMRHKLDRIEGQDDGPEPGVRFLDRKTGKTVHVLRPNEKLSDIPTEDGRIRHSLHLGKAIRGAITGRWDGAKAEKLVMGEGSNVGGGFLFGDVFGAGVIDAARAQARVFQAGAQTVVWPSDGGDELVMARVESDPVFYVVAEHGEIPASDISFGAIRFSARKIATLLTLSRELLEDASNSAELIQTTLARAFACALDSLCLTGEGGSDGLLGLANQPGVGATDSVGELAWADIHNAAIGVRNSNFEPNAYIISPTNAGALDLIQATDSGLWLGPPPSLNGVQRYQTTNASDTRVFVGQWDQLAVAIRAGGNIEMSMAAGDAFKKHEVLCKLVWRGDCNCYHRAAFHVLKDVTSAE